MQEVVIVSAKRTPIGKLGGALASLSSVDLGALAIQGALEAINLAPNQVDEVYFGNVLQAGQGQNVARQATLQAGLPQSVPATTINAVCGSGLQAINLAARAIMVGDADVMVAGGTESMTNAPYLVPGARQGLRYGNTILVDSAYHDGLEDAFHNYPMGITAENIVDQYALTRQDQDAFGLQSQARAQAAQAAGKFADEIIPIEIKTRKNTVTVTQDEAVRDTSMELLGKLKPSFKADGSVTAGNSSGINDGAAAVVMMSTTKAKELGLTPFATWTAGKMIGLDPSVMGLGPIEAIRQTLAKANLTVADLDLIELNEAFAAQSLAVTRELNLPSDITNVNGGAIALGHPIGASGARIVVTLLHEMQKRNAHHALASLCIGGGMGIAATFKN
ncbi:acetyl-CoA C-acetyltransferase [Limosilactobacillus equigenerosi]|uniref:acetyl-CoA C-acetyltransferase n=1 Tax=Limosilactobacillus equigenerosi DSM 18793 = JCM 14505 TaxID=1423742 RepID=A0A0R1UUD8_9LACO|nr:acetyl-CoA C-acetyltransferase [Limosilactobacillus equigenerosi]KRL96372.1 Acetyl-CoA acetyltransferase [Limosilactobacillus equigenerosi DSM 18793 = JCM 14505]